MRGQILEGAGQENLKARWFLTCACAVQANWEAMIASNVDMPHRLREAGPRLRFDEGRGKFVESAKRSKGAGWGQNQPAHYMYATGAGILTKISFDKFRWFNGPPVFATPPAWPLAWHGRCRGAKMRRAYLPSILT